MLCSPAALAQFQRRVEENNVGAKLRQSHVPFVMHSNGSRPYGYVSPIDCKM